jgi:hypothetical protein
MKLAPRALLSRGFFFARSIAISRAMSPRPRPRPKPKPRVSKPAHDAALHFLARPKQYPLSESERTDLIQVVEGFTSPHDREAARRGIEWMREHHRRLGQAPRF